VSDLRDSYTNALSHEIRYLSKGRNLYAHTVYLGGGTPSLIPAEGIRNILGAIREGFFLQTNSEISMEINPESVDKAYLQKIRDLGVNRLSIGVQSSIAAELQLLRREHDFDDAVKAAQSSREVGFENINLDLIYGLPGQTLSNWRTSLQAILELNPDHLSLYCLTIEPGTPMKRWLSAGSIQSPDPDLAADQFYYASELLAEKGYEHYEISNWAQPGKQCEHNLSYWRNHEYLGFGAGAHGHAAGYRYSIVKQPRVYIRRLEDKPDRLAYPFTPATIDRQQLSKTEAMSDSMITELRLLQEGLDIKSFEQKFGISPMDAYPGIIEQLLDWELMRSDGQRLLLTERGWFLSNQVFYRFM
jgi:oxygen-independent coproporphyrinogen-3 oxidase